MGNLLYHTRIPLVDALTGFKVDVPTLDNRILRVNIKDTVTPNYTKIQKGEGMPSSKGNFKGDLIITFEIVYPGRSFASSLTDEQKVKLAEICRESSNFPLQCLSCSLASDVQFLEPRERDEGSILLGAVGIHGQQRHMQEQTDS